MAGINPGEVPAILQRGEVVLPRGSRGEVRVNFAPTINAPGADRAGLAEVREQLRIMQETLPATIQQSVGDPRRR